ncbi:MULTISPECIES: glycosyltransferase family 4 protein [unclassified Methylobacterium]|uniref:glycosyltransferase family 4 protein n=1 Tax=unclassified Methylobacterium TaxID=2615210 RepID=UPI0011C98898|nr:MULTISPECIES: glycosyltransferase family 4 protein [unclassified Methylobacterium]MCJ2007392.1 glycosyltransferase family 4 protein [Methylobacterium sp. J-092]TXN62294.1 glycosyltransferase family 4 protein [Methylobacterium sp. WL6]
MRILHLSSLYPPHIVGGAERSVEHLAEELAGLGHTVAAACIERQAEPKTVRNGVTVYRMAHHNDFWLEDWAQHGRFARNAAKLKQQWNFAIAADFGRVLDDFRPDVVNTHSLLDISTLVWREAARRDIPIVHTVCEYDLICGNAAMFKHGAPCTHWHLGCKVVNASKQLTNRWVDAVASVGTRILQTHVDHGLFRHLAPERRRVIYYSCTVPDGDPEARRRVDRSAKPMTFGYLGRINVEKGVGTLIDALAEIGSRAHAAEGNPASGGWRCLIAGQAMDDSIERFKAKAEGLPIEFVGWVDPKDFLTEVDVLVVPSFWAEPSPRTVYEAYAMGVPVIGADSGGIPELIGEDNVDWLFRAGDAPDLADRIRTVLARGRASLPDERAFQHVLRESTSERVAEKYLDLYAELLAERRGIAPEPSPAHGIHHGA